MVWPDRRPKPAMWEHKRLAAPVRIGGGGGRGGGGRIESRTISTSAISAGCGPRYELTVDGVETASGAFDLPAIGPGEHGAVVLPGWVRPDAAAGEAFLTVAVTTAEAQAWAPAGFEVCALQLPVGGGTHRAHRRAPTAEGSVDLDADGRLVHPLLAAPPTLSLWRAPTDNDRIGGFGGPLDRARGGPARAAPRSRSSAMGAATVVARHHRAGDRHRPRGGLHAPRRRRDPGRRDRRHPRTLGRPGARRHRPRGRAGPRGAPLVRRRPARDLPGPQARRARRCWDVDRRPTSTSPTSGRRRTAVTPTSAGSSFATRPAPGCGSTSTSAGQVSVDPPPRGRPRGGDPRRGPRRRPRDRRPPRRRSPRARAPPAAVRTPTPEYLLGAGRYRWTWTLRDIDPA